MRHLIDFGDLSREEWDTLYQRADQIISAPENFIDVCRGKVSCNLFYEPSTRTNFSFQTAMLRLGGSVFGFADPKSSSVAKGETLKDTIKMVSGYADVIVMRTPWEGAAKAASLYSDVPVINAGDGGHMHPTQTMADLTTITRLRGSVDGMSIGLCGDLKNGRTVHSLIKALAKFRDVRFFLIAPRDLAIPEYLRRFMKENDMPFTEVTGLEPVIPQLDVLYMTRIQRERFVDPLEYERNKGHLCPHPQQTQSGQARHDGAPSPAPCGRDHGGCGRRPSGGLFQASPLRHVRPDVSAHGPGPPASSGFWPGGNRPRACLP